MAQRNRANTNYSNQTAYRRQTQETAYIYGNAVRKSDIRRQLEEAPRRQLSHEVRKNRDKARHMNVGYVVFLMGALFAAAFILVNYIQLKSELTGRIEKVSALEVALNSMRMENDENYSRIISNVDLEDIKRTAIGELGMTYAREGQIIFYSNVGRDYMRKVNKN